LVLLSREYGDRVASLELLEALRAGANTVMTIAAALDIPSEETARQLSVAAASGLVIWGTTAMDSLRSTSPADSPASRPHD
jgi:hypothetical protein